MLEIDFDSPTPLGDQLVSQIRDAIARGELAPGAPLPSVRQVAADLGVNLNTVARAYRELEMQGLLMTARGRGTHVAAGTEPKKGAAGREALAAGLRQGLVDMKLAGCSREDAARAFQRLLAQLWPS